VNVSSSGVTSSYRIRYVTIGAKDFSIKTGIPCLIYQGSWGKGKSNGSGAMIMLLFIVAIFIFYAATVVAYNLFLFVKWALIEHYHFALRTYFSWKEGRGQHQQRT